MNKKNISKNDIAHLWARKWFFLFTWVKEKMILHTCKPIMGFFIHISEKKNDIAPLKTHKWFFQLTHEKERNDIAHTSRNQPKCNHFICNYLCMFLQLYFALFYNYTTTSLQLFWFSSFYVNNI